MIKSSRARRGILLYFALGLMLVLAILSSIVWMLGRFEDISADQVKRSEALTAMGEAVLEEAFLQITDQLNTPKSDNKIYNDVREPKQANIKLDDDYLKKITVNSRKMLTDPSPFAILPENIKLQGKVSNIEKFDVKGFTDDAVKDPIEKHASLELEVWIKWQDQSKTVAISRPFKVVKVVMPVFAECTLFLNNGEPKYFGQWPSVYGYSPSKYPETQPTLEFDNGWHGYAKSHKKSDFIKRFEEDVIPKGAVPPGRIFINKGVVPLTNGDKASGALQKTFNSAESELLPAQAQFPLKTIKEQLKQYGLQVSPDPVPTANTTATASASPGASPAPSPAPSPDAGASPAPDPSASPGAADAVPGSGELFVRYVGHGEELKSENVKVGGKSMDGYAPYFYSLINGPWTTGDNKIDPALSGLDLFGRVVEKTKGQATEGGGFFGRIFGALKRLTSDLLNKLYSQYDIRISPTLVYGDVVLTYYRVLDYVETGWLAKMQNTFTFNPNQFPLPTFKDEFLDAHAENTALSKKEELPSDWPDAFKDKFLKLPEDIRKPKFFKILQKTIFAQQNYGLPNDFVSKIPAGAVYAHYNEALLNYLTPDKESRIRTMFNQLEATGNVFLKNEVDKQMQNPAGPFWKLFTLPLTDFNPFLFYVKATDYISSLYDPKDPRRYLFYEKYFNKKDKCFDLKGIIYITGTEDLILGKSEYRGKCMIITFGRVVFNGHFVRKADNDKPDDRAANANLTIISLGGVVFDTSERVDAQIYSYIYPPVATPGHQVYVYGNLGANNMDLDKFPEGGRIVYDYTYHVAADLAQKDRVPYYHVAITNEVSRYGYSIRRDDSGLPVDTP